jgi:hypothetical protein
MNQGGSDATEAVLIDGAEVPNAGYLIGVNKGAGPNRLVIDKGHIMAESIPQIFS